MSVIDLQKLRHAVAVSRAGSYSAAAKEIHISQSALTRSVNLLEQAYGVRLFERGRTGAKLTLEGAQFIKVAEDALRGAQIAHEQLARLPAAHVPLVSFGMGPMTATSLLPNLLPLLRDEGTRYRIRIQSNSALQLMLRQGDLDFFLGGMRKGTEFHTLANQFSVQPIATTAMNLLVRPGHPLLSQQLTPEAISMYPTAGGSFVRETFGLATIARYGLQEPILELDDYQMLMRFVFENDLILICSRMMVRTELGARLIPLDLDIDIANQTAWAIVSSARADLPLPVRHTIHLIVGLVSNWIKDDPTLEVTYTNRLKD
jgi:DNA-binding transcriptional LysR family regulator